MRTEPLIDKTIMKPDSRTVLKLLDRALIGLLIFIVMLLLGMQAVHAAG